MDGINRSSLATNQMKGGGTNHPPRCRLVERGTPRGVRHDRWRLLPSNPTEGRLTVVGQTFQGRVIRRFYPMHCCGGRATGTCLLSAIAGRGHNGAKRVTNPVEGERAKAPLRSNTGESPGKRSFNLRWRGEILGVATRGTGCKDLHSAIR